MKKKCFVISPIGGEGSEVRKKADKVFKLIIQGVCASNGYKAIRADKIADPGIVSNKVILEIIKSDMVIADITGHNPNVFYEIGIRHFLAKPIIIIKDITVEIPFNISQMRVINYDASEMGGEIEAIEKIDSVFKNEKSATYYENPIAEVLKDNQDIDLSFPYRNATKILRTHKEILKTNISIAMNASRVIITTGSRSRDPEYLNAIEEKLKQNPKTVYYRVLYGAPRNKILRTHLINVLTIRDPKSRKYGEQTLYIGRMQDNYRYPEWFICANEKKALIVIPSSSGEGKYDTAILIDDTEIIKSYESLVHSLIYSGQEIFTKEEIEQMNIKER